MGNGNDRIISWGDAGEPDPAQTSGAEARVNPALPDGEANDIITGGGGRDIFEFRALIDAKPEIIAQHTREDGSVNWARVAGENDNVHDHWVNGFGLDTILDYDKAEGDKIVIAGHTAQVASITYGSDAGGDYSLITVISQQGDGGAGGANTETGAHDEDPLGQIKVYGSEVTEDDLCVKNTTEGIDRLTHADTAYGGENGTVQQVYSNEGGNEYFGNLYRQTDKVQIGEGAQVVNAGGGRDIIFSYSDDGEPDPAQGGDRVNPAVADGEADDIVAGGQGRDTFAFRLLLNAKEEILDKHTRDDGSINWREVAGENGDVHDHWVEGIGDDTILDFSNQDGDKIDIRGHTVEMASIEYDADDGADYSLITLRSQQGDGGGAHDEDPLGTIKVYGDKVSEDDIRLEAGVFYGIDDLEEIAAAAEQSPADNEAPDLTPQQWGADDPETIEQTFTGGARGDWIKAGSGSQTVDAGAGRDRIISYADAGEPDPAQGGDRMTEALPDGASDDSFTGGSGRDIFEFRALLNARPDVLAQHTNAKGQVNWRGVAGENDDVHGHWVEGWGFDTITDFSKEEGDRIVVRGHTVEIESITQGSDADGAYSLITVISQQGDGGAGGANTETGAHDEDFVGVIKVYGDEVSEGDITVKANVFDGVDRLEQVDALADYNGGTQQVSSSTDGETVTTASDDVRTRDLVTIGEGAQTVEAGGGNDRIRSLGDAGEADPAQGGARINPAVAPETANDVISGGQGRDRFVFNPLLNATIEVLARHTRADGSINWRKVAGENDAVHDHWVEGVGDEVLLDYSEQDGDRIILRGHTVEIASIEYDADDGGDYSLITLRSQQGDGGGAHDEDPLGTIKVYGDKVTEDEICVQSTVFDGVDQLGDMDQPAALFGDRGANTLDGTGEADNIHGRSGADVLNGGSGNDFLFGGGHNDTLDGGAGDDWLEGGWGRDIMDGGDGNDVLHADGGIDTMTGGGGDDRFMFSANTRGGTITDWDDGVDTIDLSRLDNVASTSDIVITAISDTESQVSFENDAGKLVQVNVESGSAFSLTAEDFLI